MALLVDTFLTHVDVRQLVHDAASAQGTPPADSAAAPLSAPAAVLPRPAVPRKLLQSRAEVEAAAKSLGAAGG